MGFYINIILDIPTRKINFITIIRFFIQVNKDFSFIRIITECQQKKIIKRTFDKVGTFIKKAILQA